ncbi:DNA mismatch repair protein MutS, partial [Acidithiobacillus sp. GGI-221]
PVPAGIDPKKLQFLEKTGFQTRRCDAVLERYFGERLVGFGCNDWPLALRAAAALLNYAETRLRSSLSQ